MTRKDIQAKRGRLEAMPCSFHAWNLGGSQPQEAPGQE